jgi:3-methyladenine DNA glycosylase AlkD
MTAQAIVDILQGMSNKKKARKAKRFFKMKKGEYGAGDVFWGISVPNIKPMAKAYRYLTLSEIGVLLKHPVHEVRLCALLIMVEQFKTSIQSEKQAIVDLYLSNTQYINNWDLVDLSCYNILGKFLLDKPRRILYRLVKSKSMWEQRIAIVSTYVFIHNQDFKDTLAIAKILLSHPHDLIHKATGWMLREVAKRDEPRLLKFIQIHYKEISRTTLRYAIERLPEQKRKNILKGKFE